MKHGKRVTLALVLALASPLAAAAPAQAAEQLVGYVNLQRALFETEEGKKALANLEKTFNAKQAELQAKEKELATMKERLSKGNVDKDDPKTRAELMEFQKKFLALREQLMEGQQELKTLEDKARERLTKNLRKVIAEVGKKGGYTLIIEETQTGVLFAKGHLDLTNEVIRRYNARHK